MKDAVPRAHSPAARDRVRVNPGLHLCRCLFVTILLFSITGSQLSAVARPSQRALKQKIEALVHEFSPRLGISQRVEIAIVGRNARLISVAFAPGRTDLFRMSFEEQFLRTLDNVELRAAVAHEMGHLWIYTHFPFLQTEVLANKQALKLVAREELARVYVKMWAHNGEQGNLTDVLGPEGNAEINR